MFECDLRRSIFQSWTTAKKFGTGRPYQKFGNFTCFENYLARLDLVLIKPVKENANKRKIFHVKNSTPFHFSAGYPTRHFQECLNCTGVKFE